MIEFLVGLTLLGKIAVGIAYLVAGILFTSFFRCVGILKYDSPYDNEVPPLLVIFAWPFFVIILVVIGSCFGGNKAVNFITAWLAAKCQEIKERFKDRIRED